MLKLKTYWLPIVALTTSLLVGCASSPDTRLYVLSAQTSGQVANWGQNGPNVLVGPVNVPGHIKRSEIVYRASNNLITLNEYDRWAESINQNISEVLSENLTNLLASNSVYTEKSNFLTRPDVIIRVDVNSFGLVENQQVVLQASWEIEDRRNGSTELKTQRFQVTPQGEDAPAVVAAMSTAIKQLSEILAQQLAGPQVSSPS
ncbi:MAG: PqiC family protein [Litorimonas sp.]